MESPIADMVEQRRKALARKDSGSPTSDEAWWGLSLSGGGIRSATFCFGLIQALAHNRLLLRFDLLSTVSGGGYVGAMLGRLFHRAKSAADAELIQQRLGQREDIWLSWWLRANGRYLVPAGVRDKVFALAVYLRNLAGLHLEIGIVAVALGGVLACIDTLGWEFVARIGPALFEIGDPMLRDHFVWIPTPWLLLLPLLLAAATLCWAFWLVPRIAQNRMPVLQFVPPLALGAVTAKEWSRPDACALEAAAWLQARLPTGLLWGLLVVVIVGLVAYLAAAISVTMAARRVRGNRIDKEKTLAARASSRAATDPTPPEQSEEQKLAIDRAKTQDLAVNQLTHQLANVIGAMGWVLAAGLLDRLGWWLAFEYVRHQSTGYSLAIIMAVLRVALSPSSGLRAIVGDSATLATILSIAGRVMTFLLFGWWVGAVDRVALAGIFHADLRVVFGSAWMPLGVLLALIAIYSATTGANTRFINLSSLHGFYRARLVRSYLGATNPWRFGPRVDARPPLGAIEPMTAGAADPPVNVADSEPHDDVLMSDYHPHRNGGPVHLINVCLNETTDPRGGLFNRDRRGRALTVGPQGVLRVGQQSWDRVDPQRDDLTLGSWMAISGAAISPGMGSNTRGGIPSLLMFAGARLGFWWDSHLCLDVEGARHTRWAALARWRASHRAPWIKLASLLRETFGRFGGPGKRDWFLTDGGHFENTGAYALLAEKTRLIVLADCGADPKYRFADIENLVRKARIDLHAEIEFCKPRQSPPPPTDAGMAPEDAEEWARTYDSLAVLVKQCGSLNDLASDHGAACFALARVHYCEPSESGPSWLLLVKPNLCRGLPVDLFNFKEDHPAFPQQGTADQFFDEAQWESYFQLGAVLGAGLTADGLTGLLKFGHRWFESDSARAPEEQSSRTPALPGAPAVEEDAEPARMPARFSTGAVSRTIGWSAAAAVAVGAWQAVETVKSSFDKQAVTQRDTLAELASRWSDAQAASTPEKSAAAANAMAAVLLRTSARVCADAPDGGWFNRSQLAVDLLGYGRLACGRASSSVSDSPCGRLQQALRSTRSDSHAICLVPFHTIDERDARKLNCLRYWGYDYRSHPVAICTPAANGVASWTSADDASPVDRFRPLPALTASAPRDAHGRWRTSQARNCSGWSVVPMIYADGDRKLARAFGLAAQEVGIDVAATLDVKAIDANAGNVDDVAADVTTVKIHDAGALPCATALGRIGGGQNWRVETGNGSPDADGNVIEVRFAPVPGDAPGVAPTQP